MMKVTPTPLNDLILIEPKIMTDDRGFFIEIYRQDELLNAGIKATFVQANHSSSRAGVLRGLHFQWNKPLAKLIRIIAGRAFVVAIDIRKKSPTLGQWFSLELSQENKKMLFVPPGFASGFCALDEGVDVEYQYTALYNQAGEANIIWNDPAINIQWPIENPIISPRDAGAPSLDAWLKRPESDDFGIK